MNRYQELPITKDSNGRRKLKTTFVPFFDKADNDIYVITDPSDRLDLLANQFYGDVTAWPIIATANNIGLGSLNIEAGIQLRIPDPAKFRDYVIQINNFNSKR
jgi:phage tail protein X